MENAKIRRQFKSKFYIYVLQKKSNFYFVYRLGYNKLISLFAMLLSAFVISLLIFTLEKYRGSKAILQVQKSEQIRETYFTMKEDILRLTTAHQTGENEKIVNLLHDIEREIAIQ